MTFKTQCPTCRVVCRIKNCMGRSLFIKYVQLKLGSTVLDVLLQFPCDTKRFMTIINHKLYVCKGGTRRNYL